MVLRGARQVGKTTLVKVFSKQFKHFIHLNLELLEDKKLFEQGNDVKLLLQRILLRNNITEDLNNTLLFIDEIQESPEAISMLRYFYEELPTLAVIAAGSLLDFALEDIKHFPVGRVEFYYLYPLCFEEYLMALNKVNALEALKVFPFPEYALDTLFDLFNQYCLTGGMPEIVSHFVASDASFASLIPVYEGLWQTYLDNTTKYAATKSNQQVIRHVLDTAPAFFDQRITFNHFGKSAYRSREIGDAFRQLQIAGLIQLIYPSTQMDAPVIPDLSKSPRMQFLDTGLLLYRLGLQGELLALKDLSDAARGAIIPHAVFQERIALQEHTRHLPLFWVREKKQSSAEVDYLYVKGSKVIPVEIKSGKIGKLRSLHVCMDYAKSDFAFRLHYGGVQKDRVSTPGGKSYTLISLPYFLAAQIDHYLDF